MIMKLQVRKVGDEILVAIPSELLARLGWEHGDICEAEIHGHELRVVRTETAKHAAAMKIARRGMEKYRETLAKLAKS
jgi:antitoxin component of MazEF toxin-antitoxin module